MKGKKMEHIQDTLEKEDPDYDRNYPSYTRFPPQALCALYMPWEHKPTPLSDALPSMVFFTETEYGIAVNAEKDFPRVMRSYSSRNNNLIAVLPGDVRARNTILKRFSAFVSEKSKYILQDVSQVREYIEDVQMLYSDLNEEMCLRWTPELWAKMTEPLSYYDKRPHMIVRCGDEVVIIATPIRSDIAERFRFPDLTLYDIKDREAQPELLAFIAEDVPGTMSRLNQSLGTISLAFSYGNCLGKDGRSHSPVHPYSDQVVQEVKKLNAKSPISAYIRTWFNYHAQPNVWDGSKKTCSIPECDWYAGLKGKEGHCIVHYYQHRDVAWQHKPTRWMLNFPEFSSKDPRLVQHVYLLRPREQKEAECRAENCTRPQLSADGLCNGHKREEMNGFPFSLGPPISYDGYSVGASGVYKDQGDR